MKKLGRWLALYLAFTVEVQIHATEHAIKSKMISDQLVSEPQACQPGEVNCAIMAKKDKTVVLWDGQEIVLSRNSALLWSNDHDVRLVRGSMALKLNGQNQVTLPSGKVNGQGLILLERQNLEVTVTTLEGDVTIMPTGTTQKMVLPSGFRVTLGAIGKSGQGLSEIPQAANPASTLRLWWSLFNGTKSEFLVLARDFTKEAPTKADLAGVWHQQMVQRELAEVQKRDEELARVRAQEEKERALMRAMFRKLNHLD